MMIRLPMDVGVDAALLAWMELAEDPSAPVVKTRAYEKRYRLLREADEAGKDVPLEAVVSYDDADAATILDGPRMLGGVDSRAKCTARSLQSEREHNPAQLFVSVEANPTVKPDKEKPDEWKEDAAPAPAVRAGRNQKLSPPTNQPKPTKMKRNDNQDAGRTPSVPAEQAKDIAERIRAVIEQLGWNKWGGATKGYKATGIPSSTWSLMQRGKGITQGVIERFSKGTGCDKEWLTTGEGLAFREGKIRETVAAPRPLRTKRATPAAAVVRTSKAPDLSDRLRIALVDLEVAKGRVRELMEELGKLAA